MPTMQTEATTALKKIQTRIDPKPATTEQPKAGIISAIWCGGWTVVIFLVLMVALSLGALSVLFMRGPRAAKRFAVEVWEDFLRE